MRKPLSREAVEELAEGTPIEVIWSGGNGPHRYIVHVEPDGQRYATQPGASDRMLTYNPLDFVGRQRYHTRVWLAEASEQAASPGEGEPNA